MTNHVEALLSIFVALFAGSAVHASTFAIVHSSFVDSVNGRFQVVVHGAIQDGMADVVAKIKGTDQ